jgi:hypothetical protein
MAKITHLDPGCGKNQSELVFSQKTSPPANLQLSSKQIAERFSAERERDVLDFAFPDRLKISKEIAFLLSQQKL